MLAITICGLVASGLGAFLICVTCAKVQPEEQKIYDPMGYDALGV